MRWPSPCWAVSALPRGLGSLVSRRCFQALPCAAPLSGLTLTASPCPPRTAPRRSLCCCRGGARRRHSPRGPSRSGGTSGGGAAGRPRRAGGRRRRRGGAPRRAAGEALFGGAGAAGGAAVKSGATQGGGARRCWRGLNVESAWGAGHLLAAKMSSAWPSGEPFGLLREVTTRQELLVLGSVC